MYSMKNEMSKNNSHRQATVPIESRMLTAKEIANYLGIRYNAACTLLHNGTIPAIRLGRQWRIRQQDFDKWITQNIGCTVYIPQC